jgi:hypothetical protein
MCIFNKRPLKENEPREPTMEGLRVGLNAICAEFENQVEIERLVEKVKLLSPTKRENDSTSGRKG